MEDDTQRESSSVSPELVLVSPELASAERRALHEPGYPFWRDRPAPPDERDRRFVSEEPPPAARAARWGGPARLSWAADRLLPPVVMGAAFLILTMSLTYAADALRPAVTTSVALRLETPPAAPKHAANPTAPAAPRPGHALRWQPRAGAAFYDVQVYRGTEKIFETWPAAPTVRLSGTWRFRGKLRQLRAGVYRWFVWPAFVSGGQTRYGAPLMRGAFTIAARPTAS